MICKLQTRLLSPPLFSLPTFFRLFPDEDFIFFSHFSRSVMTPKLSRSRNFAMNPKSGLKIGAFKNGAVSRHVDRELYHLAKYLVDLSKNGNFKEIDHKVWKNHRKLSR